MAEGWACWCVGCLSCQQWAVGMAGVGFRGPWVHVWTESGYCPAAHTVLLHVSTWLVGMLQLPFRHPSNWANITCHAMQYPCC